MAKQVNQKGKQKSNLIFDEFSTIYLNNMDSLIAIAQSNKVATCLGIQDFSQLRKDYGREQADVIMNNTILVAKRNLITKSTLSTLKK